MELIWSLPEPLPQEVDKELDLVPSLLRPVLFARDIRSRQAAERYLAKRVRDLHDPLGLPDMEAAVRMVLGAVADGKRIAVYGDYDVDGITGTALLSTQLANLGAEVETYIPDRFEEGYGLNVQAVEELARRAELMITVDCGTRALQEVRRAVDLGLQVIITDHHHPGDAIPPAQALINPRRPDSEYPFSGLAGVGLAYKLAQAIAEEGGENRIVEMLDLVALGTVADLAPLRDENRILVAAGLEQLNHAQRPGLRALIEVAGLRPGSVSATNIAFGLGPRLNAAGRMKSAMLALRLLLAESDEEAKDLAEKLDRFNRARQEETRQAVERARQLALQDGAGRSVLFAADEGFHEGVIGLAAARLMEEYYRPAIVGRREGGVVKASARSIPEFHITEALEACSGLLVQFGGHAAAAGFTARAQQLPELVERLRNLAEAGYEERPPTPRLEVDAVVNLQELDEALLEALEGFEPFGKGNEPPVFAAFGTELLDLRAVGREDAHLKMTLRSGPRVFDAIAFRQGDRIAGLGRQVDVAFHYEWNEYRGYRSPQLNVLDVRPAVNR